jgi:uncharacterized protein (DUF362 family)
VFCGVVLARADNYDGDLAGILLQQYEHFRATVPLKDKRVVLKPNLVEWHPGKVINTDPRVVSAVIELCKREGAREIIVAEGPGHWRNVEFLVAESGLGEVLQRHNVPFVDINHDEPVKAPNMGQLTKLEYLYLSRTIESADVLISLPKLKTHHWAGMTASMKNFFGVVPGAVYGWPKNLLHAKGIPNSIVDLNATIKPHFTIVDGVTAMEGDGPIMGRPRPLGMLAMGTDLVAVDATCARVIGLDPWKIPYLREASVFLGNVHADRIVPLGESPSRYATHFDVVESFKSIQLPLLARRD